MIAGQLVSILNISEEVVAASWHDEKLLNSSGKHVREILTPLYPIFM